MEIFFHEFVEIIFYKILFLGYFRNFSNSYFMLNNRRPVSAVFLWSTVALKWIVISAEEQYEELDDKTANTAYSYIKPLDLSV